MGWMGWTFANGIVGYLDSSNASHGAILITTSSGEKVGHYDYVGSRALMELSGSSTSLLCQWEGATRSDGSLGVIYNGSAQPANEVLRIKGQRWEGSDYSAESAWHPLAGAAHFRCHAADL